MEKYLNTDLNPRWVPPTPQEQNTWLMTREEFFLYAKDIEENDPDAYRKLLKLFSLNESK